MGRPHERAANLSQHRRSHRARRRCGTHRPAAVSPGGSVPLCRCSMPWQPGGESHDRRPCLGTAPRGARPRSVRPRHGVHVGSDRAGSTVAYQDAAPGVTPEPQMAELRVGSGGVQASLAAPPAAPPPPSPVPSAPGPGTGTAAVEPPGARPATPARLAADAQLAICGSGVTPGARPGRPRWTRRDGNPNVRPMSEDAHCKGERRVGACRGKDERIMALSPRLPWHRAARGGTLPPGAHRRRAICPTRPARPIRPTRLGNSAARS